jgi:NAD(P)H dehydrogenase (quinone)
MIALTGATGQLGRLVIAHLLRMQVNPSSIVAIVRNPAKAHDLAATGITIRQASYDDDDALTPALKDARRLLLISSSEIGQRTAQHGRIISAATRAGTPEIVYTSLLHADSSPLNLAEEHLATEALIAASGLAFTILRNGWYTENYTASIPSALTHGVLVGSAGDGRIASAARTDYAEAAALALAHHDPLSGTTHELAGDESFTLAQFAAEISRQSGRPIPYHNLPEADYRTILLAAGLPEPLAAGLASWDIGASQDALFDNSRQLSRLIGRPTTPFSESIKTTLAHLSQPSTT